MKNGLNRLLRQTSSERRIALPVRRSRSTNQPLWAFREINGNAARALLGSKGSSPRNRILGQASRIVSPEIAKAMEQAAEARKKIAETDRLVSNAVLELVGVPGAALCVMLWQAPMARVAPRLGVEVRALKRICTLYQVPTPPQGYWSTRPDRRSIRMFNA